jgi:hypothetical protein
MEKILTIGSRSVDIPMIAAAKELSYYVAAPQMYVVNGSLMEANA